MSRKDQRWLSKQPTDALRREAASRAGLPTAGGTEGPEVGVGLEAFTFGVICYAQKTQPLPPRLTR